MCTELLEMCGRDMHVWASICAHACGSVTPVPPRLHRLAHLRGCTGLLSTSLRSGGAFCVGPGRVPGSCISHKGPAGRA